MKVLDLRYVMVCVLVLAFLSGCASLPKGEPAAEKKLQPEVEKKLLEANRALDSVNEQFSSFYAQLGPVVEGSGNFAVSPAGMSSSRYFSSILRCETRIARSK